MGFWDQVFKRGSLAAGYLGVGYAASTMNSYKAESLKAYYGESEYNRRFHGYYEASSSIMMGAGIIGAGAALFKQDPISSITGSVKNYKEYKGLKSIVNNTETVMGVNPATYGNMLRPRYDEAEKAVARRRMSKVKYPKGSILFNATLAAGAASGLAAFAAGHPVGLATSIAVPSVLLSSRSLVRNRKIAALGTIPIVAGGLAAGARNPYPTAESGNIDAQYDRSSVVSRMNFSTANLVQSLYRNRKAN